MEWTARGNENIFENNIVDINKTTKFCVYGAGELGGDLYKTLKFYNMFDCFVDNNKEIQHHGCNGELVLSENEYLRKSTNPHIIICASRKNTLAIEKHLKDEGFIYNRDYFIYREFVDKILPIMAYEFFDQIFISLTQISVTERCTLRCKKCAHGCYNVPITQSDMTLEQVKKSADIFFSKVDFIQEFVLIGGEPLLYKNLIEVIEYIGSKYRDKMNIFSITSNGTITPSKELIDICKKYRVLIRISNYSGTIKKLEIQYENLRELFISNDVLFRIGKKENEWVDYGFDNYERKCDDSQLIEVFDACSTPCHEIRESKFYYCVMARSVSDNLHYDVGETDYLDFNQLTNENWKRELLEFILGYSEKGYLDMCRYCHGAEVNNYPIPAAEQMEK